MDNHELTINARRDLDRTLANNRGQELNQAKTVVMDALVLIPTLLDNCPSEVKKSMQVLVNEWVGMARKLV